MYCAMNFLSDLSRQNKGGKFMAKTNLSSEEMSDMQFIGSKEIAALMGCSVPVARQIMRRKDFPLIKCGKNLKVMKSEFIKWASTRRI